MEQYRRRIDAIDSEIVSLLGQRFEIAREIGRYKQAHGLEIYNSARERQINDYLHDLAVQNNLSTRFCIELYEVILRHSKTSQRQ